LLINSSLKRARMLREWKMWIQKIAKAVKKLLPNAEIYIIGSIARGDYVGGSDVDILIISPNLPEKASDRAKIKVLLEEELNLPYYHPFEIHLLKPNEAKPYFRRAKRDVVKIT